MTNQNLSKVDRDPSYEGTTHKFALASVAALVIHFSWPSAPFSYSDKFDWIWLLWKVPKLLSALFPIWMLLLAGEIEFSHLFSHFGYHTSGVKVERTSTDQQREDRNYLANLIIAVICALLVTVDGGNLFLDFLNWAFEHDVLYNITVSMSTLLFLFLVLFSWTPAMSLLRMRQDLPSAPKFPGLFDSGTKDESLRVTDLIAIVDKYERTLRKTGSRHAAVQDFLTKLRSERDSDTPTSG